MVTFDERKLTVLCNSLKIRSTFYSKIWSARLLLKLFFLKYNNFSFLIVLSNGFIEIKIDFIYVQDNVKIT